METTAKILLVDDDDDLRDIVRTEVMMAKGYRIVEAADCDTAIRLLQRESFDLVLLDITLPDKSGLEVLKFMNQKHLSTKVIMVTGTAGLENAIMSSALGAQDYITKPFTINYLLRSVEHVLSVERTREGLSRSG
jgi:DNA-binding NtrC family response regulator